MFAISPTKTLSVVFLATLASGCVFFKSNKKIQSDVLVAPLTQSQAQADFAEIAAKVEALYGPLRFKEERFGYKFENLVANYKKQLAEAKTDEAIFGVYARFLNEFKDGHISITFPLSASKIRRYSIPVAVAPFANDKIGVVSVEPEAASTGIKPGDELVSVDGVLAQDLEKKLAMYTALGNPVSDRHNASFIFRRKSFMTELAPTKDFADAVFRHPDGTTFQASLLWKIEPYFDKPGFVEQASKAPGRHIGYAAATAQYNDAMKGTLFEMGANKPYFLNDATKAAFDVKEVEISPEMQKKYGLTKSKYDEIFAATYNLNGLRILLVRQPGYMPATFEDIELHLNVYRAIFEQTEGQVIGMVLDQNHNPGGYLHYAHNFYRLFITEPKPALVVRARTDRRWIVEYNERAKESDPTLQNSTARMYAYYASLIEKANEAGEHLSPVIPQASVNTTILPDERYTWKKPFIILADELSGSCGDIVPMFMTRNSTAKFFGQRTMGLGGNVEEVAQLSASGASLRLTRSLFNTFRADGNYPLESWVENNGIQPDRKYDISIDDFRNNYVNYMKGFSTYLLEQIAKK